MRPNYAACSWTVTSPRVLVGYYKAVVSWLLIRLSAANSNMSGPTGGFSGAARPSLDLFQNGPSLYYASKDLITTEWLSFAYFSCLSCSKWVKGLSKERFTLSVSLQNKYLMFCCKVQAVGNKHLVASEKCSLLTFFLCVAAVNPQHGYCISCVTWLLASLFGSKFHKFTSLLSEVCRLFLAPMPASVFRSTRLKKHQNPVKQEGKRHAQEAGREPNLLSAVSYKSPGPDIPMPTQWRKCPKPLDLSFSASFQNETDKACPRPLSTQASPCFDKPQRF